MSSNLNTIEYHSYSVKKFCGADKLSFQLRCFNTILYYNIVCNRPLWSNLYVLIMNAQCNIACSAIMHDHTYFVFLAQFNYLTFASYANIIYFKVKLITKVMMLFMIHMKMLTHSFSSAGHSSVIKPLPYIFPSISFSNIPANNSLAWSIVLGKPSSIKPWF